MTHAPAIDAVVFDIGGVILDWSPRHLYRRLFADTRTAEAFLSEVCTLQWHAQHDQGTPMSETIPSLCREYPHYEREIVAWQARYIEMVEGYVEGMEELVTEVQRTGTRVYALTNMPAEVVPDLRAAFPTLAEFDGMVVSGEELVVKPDPELYRRLIARFGVDPERSVFVDDVAANVAAAAGLGFRAVHFSSAVRLREELSAAGVSIAL